MRWRSAGVFAGLLPLAGCATPTYLPPPTVIVHSSPAEEPAPRPDPKPLKKPADTKTPAEALPNPTRVPPVEPGPQALPAPRRAEPVRAEPQTAEEFPDATAPAPGVEPLVVPALPAPTPSLPPVATPPAPVPASENP